jgi:uncharacterized RDD family membrane protein YckC
MKRSDQEPLLFDLPLDRPARDDRPDDEPAAAEPRGDRQPLRRDRAEAAERRERSRAPANSGPPAPRAPKPAAVPPPPSPPTRATAAAAALAAATSHHAGALRRLAGGGADVLVHAAVGVLAYLGCRALGVFPVVHDWPAGVVFLLAFSFLYTVVPLAFWGHTLGMTWAGLTSQSDDGEPLSFDQTARRWLGGLLTLATLGLALVVAMSGRSVADRLSGSLTFPAGRSS